MEIISPILDTGFFGVGLILSSLILFVIGLPVQIYKNYKRKTVEGISLPLFSLYFSAYAIWLLYGFRISELPIVIPNVVAVLASGLLLTQFIIYPKK